MKKFFTLLLLTVCACCAFARDIQVTVAVESSVQQFNVVKELETHAKKEAIKKYIRSLNAQTPETLLVQACGQWANFIDFIKRENDPQWYVLGANHYQLSGSYTVTVAEDKINSWLKEQGFSHQAAIELVILEEPPSLGQIKMSQAFGNDIDGTQFFLQHYTTFQRRIRDALIKKADSFGFDIKLLADNDLYSEFKTLDSTLVGVYFDTEVNDFRINNNLLSSVKENNPDTIVLYYRIDSLTFNSATRNVRATVALNFKDLNTGVTKAVGAQTFEFRTRSTAKDEVMDDIAYCAETALNALMNDEGMAARLNSLAMSIKNSANFSKGPVKLIINANAFDKKIRKRAMYMIKKELIARKLVLPSRIKSTNTTISAEIAAVNIQSPDVLYMEYLYPILENIGIELDDEKVHYDGNTLNIRP